MLFFEIQESGRDPSMMEIGYKLTKNQQKLKNLKIENVYLEL